MVLNLWPVISALVVASSLQTPPVPKPFPQPGQPTTPPATTPATTPVKAPATTTAPPAANAPASPNVRTNETRTQAPAGTPTEATLGVPIYPTSEFLESFDAGRGQRYYLFGTNAAYTEIVGYYRTVMKNGGRAIFEAPAMQQWELGKFQEQTMAYPPSIVVKDYNWSGSTGYLFVDGAKEKRFRTVIQIVPAAPAAIK